jgi:hypothetical protein
MADVEHVSERGGRPVITPVDFTLAGAILVCGALPEAERDLYARIHGRDFDADAVAAHTYAAPGMKWVFAAGRNPVAVGGFGPVTPGTFRTWFYGTGECWEHGSGITEAVGGLIREALKLAHRIETVTLADQEKARAWYPRIGLTYESTLRGYGANGEAAVMYSALRDPETA